jgi:hypothetical protein
LKKIYLRLRKLLTSLLKPGIHLVKFKKKEEEEEEK